MHFVSLVHLVTASQDGPEENSLVPTPTKERGEDTGKG